MKNLFLSLFLAGCTGPTDDPVADSDTDADAEPYRPPAANECEPKVLKPTALGGGQVDEADRHADTFGSAPEPYQVRYGWPSSDPSTSASFVWRTDTDTLASIIEYGVDGAMDQRLEGASFCFGGSGDDCPARIHEVKICSTLEPDTVYSYRVGGDGHFSDTYSFTTPPAPGSFDTFRVAFAGDSRGAYETWGQVLELMDSHEPDFFVFSGDMVDLGPDQNAWDAWFEATGDILTGKALVPAHGNHEFLATNYFAQFSLPGNEQWFHYSYGNLTLASLNDTVSDLDDVDVHQAAYLDEVFDAADGGWRLATHHQSIYSACTRHRSNLELRAAWGPLYDKHDLQVVVAGHNHIYERSLPVKAEAVATGDDGTVYIVTGGAGAPLYSEVEATFWGNVANPIEHYIVADFAPDSADFVVRDMAGNVIDEFTVER
jgi:hypothetical protein